MNQIIETISDDGHYGEVRLIVRRRVIGPEWSFEVGDPVWGVRDGKTWKLWPPDQYCAFITGVPRWYVRRATFPEFRLFEESDE